MDSRVPGDAALVHHFPDVLTHRQAMAERARLLSVIEQGAVRVDMRALEHFDSSVLAVMLAAVRAAQVSERSLSFESVPEKLRELARLYGLQELLPDAFA